MVMPHMIHQLLHAGEGGFTANRGAQEGLSRKRLRRDPMVILQVTGKRFRLIVGPPAAIQRTGQMAALHGGSAFSEGYK